MAAGKYDKRIQVQTVSSSRDGFGQQVKQWVDLGHPIWAELNYGSGAERRVGAAQEQSSLPITIAVRYSSFTKLIKASTHRFSFDGLVWDIESVAPGTGKNRNREFVFIAKAQT